MSGTTGNWPYYWSTHTHSAYIKPDSQYTDGSFTITTFTHTINLSYIRRTLELNPDVTLPYTHLIRGQIGLSGRLKDIRVRLLDPSEPQQKLHLSFCGSIDVPLTLPRLTLIQTLVLLFEMWVRFLNGFRI